MHICKLVRVLGEVLEMHCGLRVCLCMTASSMCLRDLCPYVCETKCACL